MLSVLNDPAAERSDSIRFGPSAYGIERAEVDLATRGCDPHRHHTYGIGVTTAGVVSRPSLGDLVRPAAWPARRPILVRPRAAGPRGRA